MTQAALLLQVDWCPPSLPVAGASAQPPLTEQTGGATADVARGGTTGGGKQPRPVRALPGVCPPLGQHGYAPLCAACHGSAFAA